MITPYSAYVVQSSALVRGFRRIAPVFRVC